jgi:hypothetical protein
MNIIIKVKYNLFRVYNRCSIQYLNNIEVSILLDMILDNNMYYQISGNLLKKVEV